MIKIVLLTIFCATPQQEYGKLSDLVGLTRVQPYGASVDCSGLGLYCQVIREQIDYYVTAGGHMRARPRVIANTDPSDKKELVRNEVFPTNLSHMIFLERTARKHCSPNCLLMDADFGNDVFDFILRGGEVYPPPQSRLRHTT